MSRQILAVDDEPHMLRLLERIVADKTLYGIVATSNSLEVPRLLEKHQFDIIVTDLKMPGMDGLDILRLVQQRGCGEQVIIITAFGSLDTAMEALSSGVFDYINKPFRQEEFLFTIHRAMRSIDQRREAERQAAIFDMEPYQRAQAAFEAEYAARLQRRAAGDLRSLAERSGIDADRLEHLLTSYGERPSTDARQ